MAKVVFNGKPVTFRRSTSADAPAIHAVWRRSVRATHRFLSPADFEAISAQVAEAYAPTAALVLAECDGRLLGFLGMTERHIDALFVDPDAFGRGLGRAFVEEAGRAGGPLTVDVNEQNHGALAFYERLGFAVVGRSNTDDQGRPYPLLHLRSGG